MPARPPRTLPALAALLAAAALAACGGEGDDPPAREADPAAEVPAVAPATPALGEPAAEPAAQMAGGVPLTVATSPEHGRYLADSEGRALYVREGDPASLPPCVDYRCMEMWPPLVLADAAAEMVGDPAVQRGLVGTVERPGGARQVTYGGNPLFYYGGDTGQGQTAGQDVTDEWGEWYLVQPSGERLEHHGEGEGGS